MLVALVHLHPAALRGAVEAEGDEELVQQTGVVGVAQVLVVHLPVAHDALALVAEDLDRLLHHHVEVAGDQLAKIAFKRLGLFREAAEHHPAVGGHAQLGEAVATLVEILVHPALVLDAALERDAAQVAVQVVVPAVVDAGVARVVAARLAPHQRAAVRATVLASENLALHAAADQHRRLAEPGGAEIARLWDLGLEAQVAPHRAAEDALLLERVYRGVVEQTVRDARIVVALPGDLLHRRLLHVSVPKPRNRAPTRRARSCGRAAPRRPPRREGPR